MIMIVKTPGSQMGSYEQQCSQGINNNTVVVYTQKNAYGWLLLYV